VQPRRSGASALIAALVISVTGAALLSGCADTSNNGTGPVTVSPPSPPPDPQALAECAALRKALPATLDGLPTRGTHPSSPLTAAWGHKAVVLRCGIPRPEVFSPNSPSYDPTGMATWVNGVSWYPQQTGSGYTFFTTDRAVWIELTVPNGYGSAIAAPTDPLVFLAAPILRSIPDRNGKYEQDVATSS
jgi:hypothetical protein